MKKLILTIACLALLLDVRVRGQTATPAPTPQGLVVHLMVYSGVQDPYYVITDPTTIANILSAISALPGNPTFTSQSQSVVPGILGYKGFHVVNFSGTYPTIASFNVYGRNLEIRRASGEQYVREFHLDAGGAPVEGQLFSLAHSNGIIDTTVARYIGSAMR
jgi:hypothetical protein